MGAESAPKMSKSVSYTHLDVYKRQVYHKAGDKVATIVTNDKGIARIDDLPLGKYYLVETKTIDGFVLDDTQIEADLSYIDQNKKFVFAGCLLYTSRCV